MLWYILIHHTVDCEELWEAELPSDIMEHINSCEIMYKELYESPPMSSGCACRKLLSMGFMLTATTLEDLCLGHCGRWKDPAAPHAISGW